MNPSSPLAAPNSRCIKKSPKFSANFSLFRRQGKLAELFGELIAGIISRCLATGKLLQRKNATLLNPILRFDRKLYCPVKTRRKKHYGTITFHFKSVIPVTSNRDPIRNTIRKSSLEGICNRHVCVFHWFPRHHSYHLEQTA